MRIAISIASLGLLLCTMNVVAAVKAKPKTHRVTMVGVEFQPADLTVAAGDAIEWVNTDLVAHTATSQAARFDSKIIQPGKSWRYTVRAKGDFPYVCTFHPTMRATVHVK